MSKYFISFVKEFSRHFTGVVKFAVLFQKKIFIAFNMSYIPELFGINIRPWKAILPYNLFKGIACRIGNLLSYLDIITATFLFLKGMFS